MTGRKTMIWLSRAADVRYGRCIVSFRKLTICFVSMRAPMRNSEMSIERDRLRFPRRVSATGIFFAGLIIFAGGCSKHSSPIAPAAAPDRIENSDNRHCREGDHRYSIGSIRD